MSSPLPLFPFDYSSEMLNEARVRAAIQEFLKKHREAADSIAKAWAIFGAGLSILSATTSLLLSVSGIPVQHLQAILQGVVSSGASGIGWNLADSAIAVADSPELFHSANESALDARTKKIIAVANVAYFAVVLPGLSAWGFASTVEAAKAAGGIKFALMSGVALGAAPALAASSFAFAAGMFITAGISARSWRRAVYKSEPINLLEDRLKKFDVLEKKLADATISDADRAALIKKQSRIAKQAEALFAHCVDIEWTTPQGNFKNTAFLKKIQLAKAHSLFAGKTIQNTDENKQLAAYLLQKQKDKVKAKRSDTIANVLGGIGAVFGAAAVLSAGFLPAAIALGVLSAVFYGASAAIKAYQLYEKRKLTKIKEENFKKVDVKGVDKEAVLAQQYLSASSNPSAFLSRRDLCRIATMEQRTTEASLPIIDECDENRGSKLCDDNESCYAPTAALTTASSVTPPTTPSSRGATAYQSLMNTPTPLASKDGAGGDAPNDSSGVAHQFFN